MIELALDGRVVVVTGGTRGIGRAITRAFAGAGAHVVVNSRTSAQEGHQLAGEINGVYVQADIAADDTAQRLVDTAMERWGRLDHVVNNAATTEAIAHADLASADDDVWLRLLTTNLLGPWHLIQRAVPDLRRHGGGSIINVGSIAGLRTVGSSIPYAVSKAALTHMTTLLARALGPEIRANVVAPGLIDTPWTEHGWEVTRDYVRKRAPLHRSGMPEEVADACLYLARATYVTGEVLSVDGGLKIV